MRDEVIWIKNEAKKYASEIPTIDANGNPDDLKVIMWKKSFIAFTLTLMLLSFLFVLSGFILANYFKIGMIQYYKNSNSVPAKDSETQSGYVVRFGAFEDKNMAEIMRDNIEKKSSVAVIIQQDADEKYSVISDVQKDFSSAEAISAIAKKDGIYATVEEV